MSNTEGTIPSSLSIVTPDKAELVKSSTKLLNDARAIVIDSQDMMEIANDELGAIKTKWKTLDDKRTSLVKPLNDVVKGINDLFRQPLQDLKDGEEIIKGAMLTYTTEQERLARIEREKQEQLARERRDQAQREAEQAKAKLEYVAATGSDEEIVQAQAEAEAAETTVAIAAAPIHYVAPSPRLSGTSVRKVWKARLPQTDEDKTKLLAFIVKNPQWLHLVDVSQSECNKAAVALKRNLKVDGIEAYEDAGIAARSR